MRVYQFRHVGLQKDVQYSGNHFNVNRRMQSFRMIADLLCKHRHRPLH